MNAEELVTAYAAQSKIIRESKRFIKTEMQKLDESEGFCEQPYSGSPDGAEESCVRRAINRDIEEAEMCGSCKILWPHIVAKFNAKKERAKIAVKIIALGNRLLKAESR